MIRFPASALLTLLLALSGITFAAEPAGSDQPDLFDPARHMRISEVKPGMKGYGLSVFKGTKIDRFEVEVISILHDFNPKYDVILVSLKGANLEHTGSIAGMSGSPIFLRDEQGRDRMVGAFAYGWPLMKDPIGGVQPIEYMLKIRGAVKKPATKPVTANASAGNAADAPIVTKASAGPIHWDMTSLIMLPGMSKPPEKYPFAGLNTFQLNPRLGVEDENVMRLRPLATPLMMTGLSPRLVEQLTPIFKAYGMVPLQAGGVSGGAGGDVTDAKLEPGSVFAVPLMTGDIEMTAVGTCTEVLGDRVFGFGHPFNNEGPVSLPLGGGEIKGIIANLMTSFKLGALGKVYGTLNADQTVGVAGRLGPPPAMIPINLDVRYTDGSGERKYAFHSVSHQRFTPLISATAITSAVTGVHELPEFNTLDYDLTIEFANGEKVRIENSMVNVTMPELFFAIGMPMIAATGNPFEQVNVARVEGTVNISPMARDATILWVNAPRLKFRPGETLKADISYRPFRASDAIMPIEFDLPRDLPEGTYQLTVSGWEQFLNDERMAKPFRFTAESIEDVFGVIRELSSVRHDAVYVRLIRQPDGIAIGRTAMPSLPSSRREVLIGAGRSNTTPFISSTAKVIRTENLMSGAAQFEVTIDKNAHVETGVGKPQRHETPAVTPQPLPKANENQPKASPKPDSPTGGEKDPAAP